MKEYEKTRGKDIPVISLTKTQHQTALKIAGVARYFFTRGRPLNISPFRGFILEGPPATGKTEIVKQATRLLDNMLGNTEVYLRFIDSSTIAAPRWGDAEEKLMQVFSKTPQREKHVILFDDVDCLMIKRGESVAREWHYSINAVMFHCIDRINVSNTMLTATTNRPDLIDEALRSRVYSIEIPYLAKDELLKIGVEMLNDSGVDDMIKEEIIAEIDKALLEPEARSIRYVQHEIVTKCLNKGAWKK